MIVGYTQLSLTWKGLMFLLQLAAECKESGIEYGVTWLLWLIGSSRKMLPPPIQILIQNVVVIYLMTLLVCCLL
jgi:hypothetical protein